MSTIVRAPEGAPQGAIPHSAAPITKEVKLTVDNTRLFVVAVACAAGLVANAIATYQLFPLKQTNAVLVERDTSSGAVRAVGRTTEPYTPTRADIQYFLGRYVTQLTSINRLTTERDLAEALRDFTRGKAVTQFNAIVDREEPIAKLRADPGFTRQVKVTSVSLLKDGAVVKYQLSDQRTNDATPRSTKYVATLQFSIIPPTDEATILKNPAGLYITDVDLARDLDAS
ncbi:MAG: hypothetical protein ING75_16080 [Rhodocyclaceae bacterium]|jgi:type IV secretory pathway component VirB8|nr:hypothetical protein [Rhodocyclaceae bacterium]